MVPVALSHLYQLHLPQVLLRGRRLLSQGLILPLTRE
jgi:hypothetical protein